MGILGCRRIYDSNFCGEIVGEEIKLEEGGPVKMLACKSCVYLEGGKQTNCPLRLRLPKIK